MSDMLEKRRVLLGVCGSIAAYKAAELARILVTRGYEVRCILTQSAQQFITPTTMQAVTGYPVSTGFWDATESHGIGHIQLADWADVLVVAPATADFIAKMAYGAADSPLLAIALATKARIMVAPAMNVNMFLHTQTQDNLAKLKSRGSYIVEPEEGALACGWNGTGRLANPEEIFFHIRKNLSSQDYFGKKILVTCGPTREAIDPVRFISNRSSGKMGLEVAKEAFRRGAEVTLVHGPVNLKIPTCLQSVAVTSAQEMRDFVIKQASDTSLAPDIIIMAAAVADFKCAETVNFKIKKSSRAQTLELAANPDILQELGQLKGSHKKPILVGFAVETGETADLLQEVRSKLKRKNADMIVGNLAAEALDLDTNRVWLIDKNGRQEEVATTYKSRVANKILDAVLTL